MAVNSHIQPYWDVCQANLWMKSERLLEVGGRDYSLLVTSSHGILVFSVCLPADSEESAKCHNCI